MTPMAGRIANANQNRFVFRNGFLQGFIAPRPPVHGVVGVLKQIRRGLIDKAIGMLHDFWYFDFKCTIFTKNKDIIFMIHIAGNIALPISDELFSFKEYLKREEKSFIKNNFYNGLIIPITERKARHNEIATSITSGFVVATKKLTKKYIITNSDQKIRIESANISVYPDAVVICGEPEFWNGREDLITNPLVVVEVLSKSTSDYDLGEKFILYQRLPSFEEYITVEQETATVESWFRIAENTWQKTTVTGIENSIDVRSIGISLSLEDIYYNIEL